MGILNGHKRTGRLAGKYQEGRPKSGKAVTSGASVTTVKVFFVQIGSILKLIARYDPFDVGID